LSISAIPRLTRAVPVCAPPVTPFDEAAVSNADLLQLVSTNSSAEH
jgi:hypothetical protein